MPTVNARIAQEAISRADIREVAGSGSNPTIVQWLRNLIPRFRGSDATAWCSAFVFEVVKGAGADMEEGHQPNAAARSWRKAGIGIPLQNALPGDVAVLSRPGGQSWQGHVGIFCRQTRKHVVVLGGNQGNRVCFKRYPIGRLLEVRRFRTANPTLQEIV